MLKVSKMTDDELNRLIETRVMQECPNVWGVELQGQYDFKCPQCHRRFNSHVSAENIPDYCTDLNAVAKAEAKLLENVQYETYIDKLTRRVHYRAFCATARQRAEAVLMAAGGEDE